MKDLTHKMAKFFSGEDFAEHGDNARLELTPAELRQISNLMTENARLKTKLTKHDKALEGIMAEIQKLRNCSCSNSDGIIDDVEDIIDKHIEKENE